MIFIPTGLIKADVDDSFDSILISMKVVPILVQLG